MTLSLILAWTAVLFTVLTAVKFIARISGNKKLNRFFRAIHLSSGVLLIAAGLLHGLLAGNPSWATFGDFQLAPVLFTLNWGSLCLILSIALALTYVFRKKFRRFWMPAHRILTAALAVVIVIHVLDVGIQLPQRIIDGITEGQTETEPENSEDDNEALGDRTEDTDKPDNGTATDPEIDENGDSSSSDNTETEETPPESLVTFSGAVLGDGVYQGSAAAFKSTVTVSVTVSAGIVTDITVVSENDTPQYFSRAEQVIDDITSEQSLEVDTVSGATYSSAGIINAVYDALSSAVISGELRVSKIDLSNSHKNRH